MAAIKERDGDNATRKNRLKAQKIGPGVFVYDGSGITVESIPTVLRVGKNVPVLDNEGMPVIDGSGRQVYEPAGKIVRDSKGTPVLGGIPKRIEHKIEVFEVHGVRLPEGKRVRVNNPSTALKLRCMSCIEEIEGDEDSDQPETDETPRTRKKPGPKPKMLAEPKHEADPEA